MSNGRDTDAEVKSLKAWLGEERFSENGGDVICEYNYACEMKSYYGNTPYPFARRSTAFF